MSRNQRGNWRRRVTRLGWGAVLIAGVWMLWGCATMKPEGAPVALPGTPMVLSQFFGLNAVTPFHAKTSPDPEVRRQVWANLKKDLKHAKELGASHVRVDMWWGVIEPEKGRFEWAFPDRVIEEIVAAGLEPYPILCYNAAWSPKESPSTDAQRAEFGAYVFEMVSRYKDHVRMWEVWNEPNITPFWVPKPEAALYAELLKVAYQKAKEADPTCTVVGLCTAGADYSFIEGVYSQGGRNYFDALSFHHYSDVRKESVLEGEIRRIRRIMDRNGDAAKPILITELGLSTGPSTIAKAYFDEDQARWMVKKHLIAMAGGVSEFYWFKMKDDPASSNPDGYWGLLRDDYSEKPSAAAYRTMTRLLTPATFVGRAYGITEDPKKYNEVEFLVFRSGKEVFGCGWVRNDGRPLDVVLPADGELVVENMTGRKLGEVKPNAQGQARVHLTEEPRYVRGLPPRALPLASIHFEPDPVGVSPGETRNVTMVIDNPLDRALSISLKDLLNPPEKGRLQIVAPRPVVEAPPDTVTRVSLSVSLPADAPRFRALQYTCAPDPLDYTYSLWIDYVEPFRVRVLVEPKEETIQLVTLFTNLTDQTVSGNVSWSLRGKEVPGVRQFSELRPGGSASVERRIAAALNAVTLVATVRGDSGMTTSKSIRLYGQPLLTQPPTIDGNLDDWADVTGLELTPEENLVRPEEKPSVPITFKGSVKTAWTQDHIYVAAEVTDRKPLVNPYKGQDLWRGDSLELYLGFGGATLDEWYGERRYQIGINPGNDGKDPYVWNWHPRPGEAPAASQGGATIADATVASRKTATGYCLEASIPLKSLHETVEPNQVIGFDVALNNTDNPKAESNETVLIWNGDGTGWKDPSKWGVGVILSKEEQKE